MKMFQQNFTKKLKFSNRETTIVVDQIFDFGSWYYLVMMFQTKYKWAKKRPGLGGGRHDTEVRVAKV